jgi:hypothetical protein
LQSRRFILPFSTGLVFFTYFFPSILFDFATFIAALVMASIEWSALSIKKVKKNI